MARKPILSQGLARLIKTAIVIAALGFVTWRLWEEREMLDLIRLRFLDGAYWYFLLALFLLPLNLFLESEKWRLLIRPFYPHISRSDGLRAVTAGMATGIFTPNRIGEYAGRLLYLREGHRLEAAVATFFNRMAQMLITLAAGLAGLAVFALVMKEHFKDGFFGNTWILLVFTAFTGLVLLFILIFLFAPQFLLRLAPKRWQQKRWMRKIRFALNQTQSRDIWRVIGLSLLRYMVFSTQYFLLVEALGAEAQPSALLVFAAISLVFQGKSLFPYLGLAELGVREGVAVPVFALAGINAGTALMATLSLYLINIILPVAVGAMLIRRLRLREADEPEAGS